MVYYTSVRRKIVMTFLLGSLCVDDVMIFLQFFCVNLGWKIKCSPKITFLPFLSFFGIMFWIKLELERKKHQCKMNDLRIERIRLLLTCNAVVESYIYILHIPT